jgi:hypothetical protein
MLIRFFPSRRDALAVRDHLHHGGEARRRRFLEGFAAGGAAQRERLIAQAMAVLQQDQPARVASHDPQTYRRGFVQKPGFVFLGRAAKSQSR